MFGSSPALQSRSRSCTSTLGELLLRCVVSHRIAPAKFLSVWWLLCTGTFSVSLSPSSSAPEGPIAARPSRSVKS